MSWDEIWMRPVAEQVEAELAYYRERFEMIVQDLATYPLAKPFILEGAACLPELIEQQGADPQRVIFLVPTREFQLHHYRQRSWIHSILSECKDPDLAFANWMRRDQLFGRTVLRQAKDRNCATILVDGKLSVDELYERVKEYFGLGR